LTDNITKKLDANDYKYSFAHLTLILLLHYYMKRRCRSLAVYNNKFILCFRSYVRKWKWHVFLRHGVHNHNLRATMQNVKL